MFGDSCSDDATSVIGCGNVKDLVRVWRNEFYVGDDKMVPRDVLFSDNSDIKRSFLEGYMLCFDLGDCLENTTSDCQLAAQGLFMLWADIGYDPILVISPKNRDTFGMFGVPRRDSCSHEKKYAIQHVEDWGEYDEYVYDLETESHHFAAGVGRLVVHNTDSLYVSCAPSHFSEYDRLYFTGKCDKIEYGTHLVRKTFEQIETAKRAVNERLRQDNGSEFLKMAYEEVLYPAAFLSKKKYYGVPHEKVVDFYPRKLFLRGLEVVKRGSSEVLKKVVNEALRTVMDIRNTRGIIDVVQDAIRQVYNTDWPIDAFAKTAVYRPDKKNPSVLTMMRRYRALNYPTIPEPNVRFRYVICKYYPWTYDIRGRQTKNTIGDCMELVERVRDEGLEIDLEYYFNNELTGQFARLITFCSEVSEAVPELPAVDTSGMGEIEADALSKERYQRFEVALFKQAKKYIGQLSKEYSNAYVNRVSLFANTWREVCGFIGARPDLYARHLNMASALALSMFANPTGDAPQTLYTWTVRHIARRYHTALSSEQEALLAERMRVPELLIKSFKLQDVLASCTTRWKESVVEFIREEYAYDSICRNNLQYSTMWDVLDRQELETILRDRALFPELPGEQALAIIDAMAVAIASTLTVSQLSAYYKGH